MYIFCQYYHNVWQKMLRTANNIYKMVTNNVRQIDEKVRHGRKEIR
jgi:uncharacterized protein YukE